MAGIATSFTSFASVSFILIFSPAKNVASSPALDRAQVMTF
jgi:hypothetical protein